MVSPIELHLAGIEEDLPDDITPRPKDELVGSTERKKC